MLKKDFFQAVAHHNLERFHSECISWVFNYDTSLAIKFILTYSDHAPEDIDDANVFSVTEFDNLDIVLIYKLQLNEEYRAIVIENKLKAKEHKIGIKKEDGGTINVFQTQYYFNRPKASKTVAFDSQGENQSIEKKFIISEGMFEEKNEIQISKITWIYLVPVKIDKKELEKFREKINVDNFENLNIWDEELQKEFKNKVEKNPWKSFSYGELALFFLQNKNAQLPKDSNASIFEGYITFLLDPKSGFIAANGNNQPQTVDLANYHKNKYGQYEYFRILHDLIKSILNKDKLVYSIEPASSNSKDPLMNIIFKYVMIDYQHDLKTNLEIAIGVQIQGERFKYFVSAKDYNNIQFKNNEDEKGNRSKYHAAVKNILDDLPKDIKNHYNGINYSKTKSFCSRIHNNGDLLNEDIRGFDIERKAKIYAERIEHLIIYIL
ncbi:MAG: hypothetical protein ACK4V4_10270 [Sphingobacteriales bacterium]|jgi:hypothetical protein